MTLSTWNKIRVGPHLGALDTLKMNCWGQRGSQVRWGGRKDKKIALSLEPASYIGQYQTDSRAQTLSGRGEFCMSPFGIDKTPTCKASLLIIRTHMAGWGS